MKRAGRNQEVVVRRGWETSDEIFVTEADLAFLRRLERFLQVRPANTRFATKIDMRAGLGIEHVIAFVLCVGHPEMLLDIARERMHLQREIAPAHRIEKIEPDREFRPEA